VQILKKNETIVFFFLSKSKQSVKVRACKSDDVLKPESLCMPAEEKNRGEFYAMRAVAAAEPPQRWLSMALICE
jgi:hypothetical protein